MSKMIFDTLKYAWTDLETTGTETEGGGILEVACIITDRALQELGRFHTLVHPGDEALKNMSPYVANMHTSNNLLRDIQALDVPSIEEADEKFADFLRHYNQGEPKDIILAGNTVEGVDLPFIKSFMPLSNKEKHYRYFDITSLRIGGGIKNGHDVDFEKSRGHRAFDDVLECIEEFKFLRAQILK